MAQHSSMRKKISPARPMPDHTGKELERYTADIYAKNTPETLPTCGTDRQRPGGSGANGCQAHFRLLRSGNILPFPSLTLRAGQAYTFFVTASARKMRTKYIKTIGCNIIRNATNKRFH